MPKKSKTESPKQKIGDEIIFREWQKEKIIKLNRKITEILREIQDVMETPADDLMNEAIFEELTTLGR